MVVCAFVCIGILEYIFFLAKAPKMLVDNNFQRIGTEEAFIQDPTKVPFIVV